MKNVVLIAAVALALLLTLFKVELNPQFRLATDVEQPDADQEARFDACVEDQDRVVHGETFAAIDNPDVQREVLARRMAEATRECRALYPQQMVTVRQPFRFNFVDLEFRY